MPTEMITDSTARDPKPAHPPAGPSRFPMVVGWFAWLVMVLALIWAFGAVFFDFPGGGVTAAIWLAAGLGIRLWARRWKYRQSILPGLFLVVWLPWLMIRPSNEREWSPEYGRAARAEINGDVVTIHDVRNFHYTRGADGTLEQKEKWESRSYRLSELRAIDLFINYWGSPWMAHPIVSFDFGPDGHIAFSIETRREVGEEYSAIGGLYKLYELTYIAGDENDLVRVRSDFRTGEDVYLYRLRTGPEEARRRFLEYIHTLNSLHARPRFYDVILANCTTSIRAQISATDHGPLDWRLLLNGKMDQLLFERKAFAGPDDLPFAEWRARAHVKRGLGDFSQSTDDFSDVIRQDRPGF